MTEITSGVLASALTEKVIQSAFEIARSNRTGILSLVSEGIPRSPFEGYKGSWLDMRVDADASALTAGIDGAVTTIQVADGTIFRAGMTASAVGSDEVVLVTAVTGNNLTVSRAFGGTTAESVLTGVKLIVDSSGREENSTASTDGIKQPDVAENYFQTFDTAIEMSRRALATMQFGNTNSMAFQISERIRQLAIGMDRALVKGRKATATISGKDHTYTGGMRYFTDQAGAIKTDAAAATLTLDIINTANAEIVSRGGTSNAIAVGVALARKLSALVSANYNSSRLQDWSADEGSVLTLPSDLPLIGSINRIVVDTNLDDSELFIFDSNMISIIPMAAGNSGSGGAWRTLDATAKGQDGEIVRIIGDYMMEMQNSKTHMARIHNLG